MATSTVENYLKTLYLEQRHEDGEMVPMGRLAAAMSVVRMTPPVLSSGKDDPPGR